MFGDTSARPFEEKTDASNVEAKPQSFMIGRPSECVAVWRDAPDAHPVWTMTSKEGSMWYDDGELNDTGRKMIIEHFGLKHIKHDLPLEIIKELSPSELVKRRRQLEVEFHKTRKEIGVSTRGGAHVPPEQCC